MGSVTSDVEKSAIFYFWSNFCTILTIFDLYGTLKPQLQCKYGLPVLVELDYKVIKHLRKFGSFCDLGCRKICDFVFFIQFLTYFDGKFDYFSVPGSRNDHNLVKIYVVACILPTYQQINMFMGVRGHFCVRTTYLVLKHGISPLFC